MGPARAAVAVPSWPARDAAHLLVRSAQMADLEEALFASGLPVEALMEKAALRISQRLLGQPDRLEQGVLVLVGPGHNGGDGLVVARELHLAGVRVQLWSPFEQRKPLTEAHWRHAHWLGVEQCAGRPDPADPRLWIDALFGTGQRRPPGAVIERLLATRQSQRPGRLVAIDVPTGLCADTGQLLGEVAACASHTYVLGLLKQGLVQDAALAWVGELERLDLGLPPAQLAGLPVDQPLGLAAADLASTPWPIPDPRAGKYGRGRLLVVAGSNAYRGAALLSLLGAGASGCGSLRGALPIAVAEELWAVQPDVVVHRALASGAQGGLCLAALGEAGALDRLDAVLLGPGIGAGHGADGTDQTLAWRALQHFSGLLVLDADGLNRVAAGETGTRSDAWLRGRQGATWLTPHAGEFARLFPDLASQQPLAAAASAAARCGVSVLLKGARSVVAAADGRRWQLLEAAAPAARAGLGDVLAGYAAGRGAAAAAAQTCSPADGALLAAAALDHAQAGLQCCRILGAAAASPQAIASQLARRESKLPKRC
ncbi:NAD(P)H-hydrate dehydratase [Synechococcus sp. CS-1325]|uniref:NAD(P)H-hydrate dehydratase n=1 Tax=Synechococcus sp. CS-1325 TaxID=2847979 RepID=UPI000DB32D0A|nr:NAD(P)H-hydrate dehydratase [Synechococcus sp. CS-1325]MCT0199276.1 NAD(P)H-hydrate dehydratase [Synechococcus sp. CS-1325]PZU96664.1 MAG: bifunctional ADP-dependent NAD(P)H-hydrate dehydratase/NAD(P)H-hydrate epimerase [Cyanobium sp.]